MAFNLKQLCLYFLGIFLFALFTAKSTTAQDSECVCGVRGNDSSKIVGGEAAKTGEFPWMANLQLIKDGQCGGSIINNMYILTAAHCTEGLEPKDAKIYVGGIDGTGKDAEEYDAAKFINHPEYNKNEQYDNDIGLIKLTKPIQFNENVSPICLAPPDSPVFANRNFTIAGWGHTSEGGKKSTVLLKTQVEEVSNEECKKAYKYVLNIVDTQMCASSPGKDACQGDSGGPMFLKNAAGKYEQDGVVSYGIGCANKRHPGVYTRVSKYRDWITENTAGAEKCGN